MVVGRRGQEAQIAACGYSSCLMIHEFKSKARVGIINM